MSKHVEDVTYQGSGVRPDRVTPLPPHALPKTTSGKIQRAYIRENILAFEDRSLTAPRSPPPGPDERLPTLSPSR